MAAESWLQPRGLRATLMLSAVKIAATSLCLAAARSKQQGSQKSTEGFENGKVDRRRQDGQNRAVQNEGKLISTRLARLLDTNSYSHDPVAWVLQGTFRLLLPMSRS
jgi:hypothetical protein